MSVSVTVSALTATYMYLAYIHRKLGYLWHFQDMNNYCVDFAEDALFNILATFSTSLLEELLMDSSGCVGL